MVKNMGSKMGTGKHSQVKSGDSVQRLRDELAFWDTILPKSTPPRFEELIIVSP